VPLPPFKGNTMQITIEIEPQPKGYSIPTWKPVYLPFDGILILIGNFWVRACDHLTLGGGYHICCYKLPEAGTLDINAIMEWKQEKPAWCSHSKCSFLRRAMDSLCAGQLLKPEAHGGDFNTHRICMVGVLPKGEIFDLKVNTGDLYHCRRILDAIDGRGWECNAS